MSTTETPAADSTDAPGAPSARGTQSSLFPGLIPEWTHTTGVIPRQLLTQFIEEGVIEAAVPITDKQIQPASLDLRVGRFAYRVPASFLPGQRRTVREQLDRLTMHTLDLGRDEGACLEAGCTYVVPLEETLRLPSDFSGIATPKSTTGRLDVFTRLLTDYSSSFEKIAERYHGPLYVEVSPRTFSVIVRRGDALNQVRFRRGHPRPAGTYHERMNEIDPLIYTDGNSPATDLVEGASVVLSVDLHGTTPGAPVAYRAKRHAREPIDLRKIGHYPVKTFWETIPGPLDDGIILRPDEFYIMATKERVRVPASTSAEMVAYDTTMGEFRVHYAGFFDPGFGDHPSTPPTAATPADPTNGTPATDADPGIPPGTRAVLEVRSHDTPVLLEHGQRIGRMVYERLTHPTDQLYGTALASNYARQGVTLAKQFRRY